MGGGTEGSKEAGGGTEGSKLSSVTFASESEDRGSNEVEGKVESKWLESPKMKDPKPLGDQGKQLSC